MMGMEKKNVVEEQRTPDHELSRRDDDWDKKAAAGFSTPAVVGDKSTHAPAREPNEA